MVIVSLLQLLVYHHHIVLTELFCSCCPLVAFSTCLSILFLPLCPLTLIPSWDMATALYDTHSGCVSVCLCSVYISCGWVAKASAVTGCQCDLWAHHTLSESASHRDTHTHTLNIYIYRRTLRIRHTHTHVRIVDGHSQTHAHIACDGQSRFIKLTPDQSQIHWWNVQTLSEHTHVLPFNAWLPFRQKSAENREKSKKSQPLVHKRSRRQRRDFLCFLFLLFSPCARVSKSAQVSFSFPIWGSAQ